MVVSQHDYFKDVLKIVDCDNKYALLPFRDGFTLYENMEFQDSLHPLEISFISKTYYYLGRLVVKDYELIDGKWQKCLDGTGRL